jgi:double-strand break repair protein MRE11
MLPLIRIRVEYTGYEVGNPQRFGQDFTDKVANPRDIVQFFKKKVINRNGKKITIDEPEGLDPRNFAGELPEKIEKIKVETLVRQYLEAQTLQMLHENGIAYAVNAFVEKDDKHAIES